MKKVISLFAACAMLLTMLCAVPVSAAPYAEYPYIYEDLENGLPAGFGLLSNSTDAVHNLAKDTTGRGGNVYKVSIAPSASNTHSFVDAVQIKDIPVVMGTTMKTSLMVYMATGTPRSNAVSIVYNIAGTTLNPDGTKSEQTFTGWYEKPLKLTWETGSWTKLENTITWTKDLAYGVSGSTPLGENTIDFDSIQIYRILFRIGAGNNQEFIVDESKLIDGAENLEFYFDEMIYEPVADTTVEEIEYGKNLFTYGDFENGQPTGFYANNDGGANKFIATTKYDVSPVDGNYGYCLNIANPDGTYVFNQLEYIQGEHSTIRYLPNRMYEFSFWYRVNELYNQSNVGYNPAVSTDTAYGDVYFKWGIGNGTGAYEKLDLNGLYASGNWPTGKYAQDDILIMDGQWHQAKINFSFDSKTFAEPVFRDTPFRATIVFQVETSNMFTGAHMDIDMDNIQMIDRGPITNGDFEEGAGYATRWVNSQGTGATATNTGYAVYGWLPDGCTLAQSDEVRANPDSGSKKSMLVTLNLNTGGRPLQALSLDNSKTNRYKLSFWAKDATLSDGESVPFAVVLERGTKVTEPQAAEVYKVPEFEFYTGKNEKVSGGWVYNSSVMETQSWRLTNEWQYFETYISNEFPVMEGKENASTKYILPRQPFMYFLYNGTNPVGATYYLDDVKLENAPGEAPEAAELVVNGYADPGKSVNVDYRFANVLGYDEGASIVRVYADGVSIGSFKARGGSFEIPETAIGKSLTFELLPIDISGNAGAALATKNVATTCNWAKMYIEDTLTAVRAYAGEAKSGQIIFAAYNGNQLVDVDVVDANITDANTLTNILADDLVLEGATRIKVMFWNGVNVEQPISEPEEAAIPAPPTAG